MFIQFNVKLLVFRIGRTSFFDLEILNFVVELFHSHDTLCPENRKNFKNLVNVILYLKLKLHKH